MMKKTISKLTSLVLCLVLLLGAAVAPANAAYGYTTESWDTLWANSDSASVHLAPGSDASQMNVAWFGSDATATPYVYVSLASSDNYSEYSGYAQVSDAVSDVVYKVTVTDLVPAQAYKYYCVSGSYKSEIFYFETATEGDFDAIFVSDIHVSENEEPDSIKNSAGNYNNMLMQGLAKNDNVSLVLSAGDNADQGLYSEYIGLFATPLAKSLPFAYVNGNHDYKAEVYPVVMNHPNVYNSTATVPDKNGGDYWFVKGNTLFLMMNGSWASSTDHKRFVDLAVKANPDVKFKVAVLHNDLYGGHLPHREGENTLMRAMYAPIFDEHKVDLVLMGHSHVYSRSHVLKDNKVVENLKGDASVTDAQGTIYFTNASVSRTHSEGLVASTRVAFDAQPQKNTYTIMNFTSDSIKINSYLDGEAEPFDTFEIIKTDEVAEEVEAINPLNDIVHFLSFFYALIRNLGQLLGID